MAILGIDLGTTNSLVAFFGEKGHELIPNAVGEFLTPSAVYLDESDTVIVGAAAIEHLLVSPERSAASFKRFMGSDHKTALGSKVFRPEELSACVLRALKQDAETYLNQSVSDVVISVPAYFNDHQRKATIDAGRLAGLNVVRIVNEPTAAVLAYGFSDAKEGKYLAFDLGGGTFDVSILDKYEGVMEIRATTGDTQLGGDDFTALLETMIAEKAGFPLKEISPQERAMVRRVAENLKKNLSREESAAFSVVVGGNLHEGRMTRQAFEEAAAGLLRRLRAPIERAIGDARMTPTEFDAIILIGGATRMPMIKSLVARLFGRLPLVHIDPDTIVALGAAVQAGLYSRDAALDDMVMTDVCPHTLGIASFDFQSGSGKEYVATILQRNAIVPISRAQQFITVANGQRTINVRVYQGEHLRPEDNVYIGNIEVPVKPGPAGTEGVDVRFTYDINGALEVEVTSLSLNQKHNVIFSNQTGLNEEELQKSFGRLAELKMPARDQIANKTLIARAERLYAEHTGMKREILRQILNQFEQGLNSQHVTDAELLRRNFSSQLDQFECEMFDQP